MERLLSIEDLVVSFDTAAGKVQAVRGVSLHVDEGELLALVGESGCGKSVTVQTVMRLNPPSAQVCGAITLAGHDMLVADERALRHIRGKDAAMIFQDPMSSLNPTMTVGKQIAEAIRQHERIDRRNAQQRAVELLTRVKLPQPEQRAQQYPHELSGGMRQRAMIAMALSCKPRLLIADEPTTALDVTVQAQVLSLLGELRQELGMAMMLITHDLALVAGLADRVAVMYGGMIVEQGRRTELFTAAAHPYTQALLASMPSTDCARQPQLQSIPGAPPDLTAPPSGCPFAPRCPHAVSRCRIEMPRPVWRSGEHAVSCWLFA